jgi:hypothetical protein
MYCVYYLYVKIKQQEFTYFLMGIPDWPHIYCNHTPGSTTVEQVWGKSYADSEAQLYLAINTTHFQNQIQTPTINQIWRLWDFCYFVCSHVDN